MIALFRTSTLAAASFALSSGFALAQDETAAAADLSGIVSHTPAWVWPLVLYALWMGLKRMQDRTVSPARLIVMPLLVVGLSLYSLAAGPLSLSVLAGLVCGGLAGALAGLAAARRTPAMLLSDGRLRVRGDWLPLAVIAGIVVVKFARGVALGVDPALATDAGFLLANAVLSGFLAAMMVARTLGMLPAGFFARTA